MTCNCDDNFGCGGACDPCSSNTAIKQAVNDALAAEKETLEGYVDDASTSASEASASAGEAASSASAVAQSQTNAETAANTAVTAATSVTETAVVLEETAKSIKAAQELLEEQVASVQTKPVYFEVVEPTSTLVLPDTDTVFNVRSIYVSSVRQAINYGFTFDTTTRTVTLAEAITEEQIAETDTGYILVEVICDVFNSDDPTSIGVSLASTNGASMVGTSNGTTVQTELDSVNSKLNNFVTLTDFSGAIEGVSNDSTLAFTEAYDTGKSVYVPDGAWFTKNFRVHQTFGPGRIYGEYTADGLFYDSGPRVISPFNAYKDEPVWFNANTRGNFERGGALSVTMNLPDDRPQIMGFNDDTRMASYTNLDAVGMYLGASGPRNQRILSNTVFSGTTVTSPDIVESLGDALLVGMFIQVTTGVAYKARVMSIDYATNSLQINVWVAPGDTSTGQIPANGTPVRTNSVTKIWGWSGIMFCNTDKSSVRTMTGFELGFQLTTAPTLCWGFDSVNYSAVNSGTRAHLARGLWGVGYYANGKVTYAVQQEVSTDLNDTVGLLVTNTGNENYAGSVVRHNTNFRNNNSLLAEIMSGGVSYWNITNTGRISSLRPAYSVLSSNTTLNSLTRSNLICTNNSVAITLTLDVTSVPSSTEFTIAAVGSYPVTVVTSTGLASRTMAPGERMTVQFDGTSLNLLHRSNSRDFGITGVSSSTFTISASTIRKLRFVGTVASTFSFNTAGMVTGQEWEIVNDSSYDITVEGASNYTIAAGGYGKFWYNGTAVSKMFIVS